VFRRSYFNNKGERIGRRQKGKEIKEHRTSNTCLGVALAKLDRMLNRKGFGGY